MAEVTHVAASAAHPDALLVPMADVGGYLGGISRSAVYELVAAGRLPTVKIGRRRFVTRADLENFVAGLDDKSAG